MCQLRGRVQRSILKKVFNLRKRICIALFCLLFILWMSKSTCKRSSRKKNAGLILDTPGCRIPKIDPFDAAVLEAFQSRNEPYSCDFPIFMRTKPDGSLHLLESILEEYYELKPNELDCIFHAIRRRYEWPGTLKENGYEMLPLQKLYFGVPLGEDYVKVLCDVKQKEPFIHYFALIRIKTEIENNRSSIPFSEPRLNVLLTGIDLVSKLNFIRHFRKTGEFMKSKGTFLEMKGFTKVGDSSFPNLNPMLTGKFSQDIWDKDSVQETMYFDDLDFIWKRYAKKGYRTLFAEDNPDFGIYNYEKRGFREAPTDYYLRPLYVVLEHSGVRDKGPWYCFNSQVEPELIYNYTLDFAEAMGPHRPFFAFSRTSSLPRSHINSAEYADFSLVNFLEEFWKMGREENTVVIIFGDHGRRTGSIHRTYIGKYEERMPFLYIHFPQSFMDQYPHIAENLRENQERLVTFFDLHATMLQLLDPTNVLTDEDKAIITPYGTSIMEKISPYRTCERAHIYPQWCCCNVLQEVSKQDENVIQAVEVLMKCINEELRTNNPFFCPVLEVEEITSSWLSQLNEMVLKFGNQEYVGAHPIVNYDDRFVRYEDLVITLTTKPGGSVFETTIRHDVAENVYCIVDVYEVSSWGWSCINTDRLRNFRYCARDCQKI